MKNCIILFTCGWIVLMGCTQNKREVASAEDSTYFEGFDTAAAVLDTLQPYPGLDSPGDTSIAGGAPKANETPAIRKDRGERTPILKSRRDKEYLHSLPRRIVCNVSDRVIKAESNVTIEITLVDSIEEATTAHKDLWISVEVAYLKYRDPTRDSVQFIKGAKRIPYTLTILHDGPIKILFNNKELMGCELIIKALDQKMKSGSLLRNSPVFQFVAVQQAKPLVAVYPPQAVLYKANGIHEAPITYSMEDPENTWPEAVKAKINVVAPDGQLSSNSVSLDRESLAVVSLKSFNAGTIKVRSIAQTNGIKVDPAEVSVTFIKDIDSFEMLMPDSLHLLEEGELTINLKDTRGINVITDRDIPYSLAIEGGAFRVEPKTGKIENGKSGIHLKVIPVSMGSGKVTLSIENYLDQITTAKIYFPTFLIFISLLGGVLGGSFSFFVKKEKNYWKIAVSLFTGPMLMWLALYLGVGSLSPTIILNPISCFLIAFIGGWAGVAVIEFMLKKFGLASTN